MFTVTIAEVKVVGTSTMMVELPNWKPRVWVEVILKDLPLVIQREATVGSKFRVSVYMNATKPKDLRIHQWMLPTNVPVVQLDRIRRS